MRILIVKLGAMGDVLRTTGCLEPLKTLYPRSHITWITRPNARDLLLGNTSIDRVLTIDGNYLELLMVEEFDLVISPDADVLSASIATLARGAEKRGYLADGRGGVRPLNEAARIWWLMGVDDDLKKQSRRTYGEWLYDICELPPPVAAPAFPRSAPAAERAASFLDHAAAGARRRICFNTGAGNRWREKRWKQRHFAEFARLLHAASPDTAVVLVGGPEEVMFNRELLAANPALIDAGCDRTVEELAALMANCDWVLTADSLGYHVASAVGTPAVCLVGPTAPWELDRYGRNLVIYSDAACIACYRSECPFAFTCMDALTPAVLWSELFRDTGLPGTLEVGTGLVGLSVQGLPRC